VTSDLFYNHVSILLLTCFISKCHMAEEWINGVYVKIYACMCVCTRCDQKVRRLIFLLGCGYTSGHCCLQGGVLELPAHISVLCELRLKRVVYRRLVIVRAVRDVGRARAARVHQVLCETGKKWCGDI